MEAQQNDEKMKSKNQSIPEKLTPEMIVFGIFLIHLGVLVFVLFSISKSLLVRFQQIITAKKIPNMNVFYGISHTQQQNQNIRSLPSSNYEKEKLISNDDNQSVKSSRRSIKGTVQYVDMQPSATNAFDNNQASIPDDVSCDDDLVSCRSSFTACSQSSVSLQLKGSNQWVVSRKKHIFQATEKHLLDLNDQLFDEIDAQIFGENARELESEINGLRKSLNDDTNPDKTDKLNCSNEEETLYEGVNEKKFLSCDDNISFDERYEHKTPYLNTQLEDENENMIMPYTNIIESSPIITPTNPASSTTISKSAMSSHSHNGQHTKIPPKSTKAFTKPTHSTTENESHKIQKIETRTQNKTLNQATEKRQQQTHVSHNSSKTTSPTKTTTSRLFNIK